MSTSVIASRLFSLIAIALVSGVLADTMFEYGYNCRANDVYKFKTPPKTSGYDQTLYEVQVCGFAIYLLPGTEATMTIPPVLTPVDRNKKYKWRRHENMLSFWESAYGFLSSDWNWNATGTLWRPKF